MHKWLRILGDHLVIYTPLFFMLLLAAFTWWLSQVSPGALPIAVQKPIRSEPDYIVHDFVAERFDTTGRLRSWLTGSQLRRYPGQTPQQDKVEIEDPWLLTTETASGRGAQPLLNTSGVDFYRTTAKAKKGYILDGRDLIELRKNAIVTRQPLLAQANKDLVILEGDELRMLTKENRIISDKPVDIQQNGTWMNSQRAVYEGDTHTLHMEGNVHVIVRETSK